MLGPLPRLHRFAVAMALLLLFGAVGGSMGADPTIPFLVGTGLIGGAAVGAVMSYALLHQPHAHAVRVRRHRH